MEAARYIYMSFLKVNIDGLEPGNHVNLISNNFTDAMAQWLASPAANHSISRFESNCWLFYHGKNSLRAAVEPGGG